MYFASLDQTASVQRPAEQIFALEEDDDREEDMVAMVDRLQWSTQGVSEPPLSPDLQADVRPRTPHGIRDVTDCSSMGFSSSDAGVLGSDVLG